MREPVLPPETVSGGIPLPSPQGWVYDVFLEGVQVRPTRQFKI